MANILKRIGLKKYRAFLATVAMMTISFSMAGAACAIDESQYEYEAYEGLHQEEWYDPSDWFDDPDEGISHESDWFEYSYGPESEYHEDIRGYYMDDFYEEDYYEEYDNLPRPQPLEDYDYYTDDFLEYHEIY